MHAHTGQVEYCSAWSRLAQDGAKTLIECAVSQTHLGDGVKDGEEDSDDNVPLPGLIATMRTITRVRHYQNQQLFRRLEP